MKISHTPPVTSLPYVPPRRRPATFRPYRVFVSTGRCMTASGPAFVNLAAAMSKAQNLSKSAGTVCVLDATRSVYDNILYLYKEGRLNKWRFD